MNNFKALGYSLTYGYSANIETAYPAVLADLSQWKVMNAGVNGDTSADVLARVDDIITRRELFMNDDAVKVEIYESADGQTQIEIRLEHDTLWLSQAQLATLFEKDSDTIGLHLKNIYKEGELDSEATTEQSSVVRQEGKRQVRRNIRFYNLDAIISVGYRVNSKKGTQFRIWATQRLREYLVQGYTLNQRNGRLLNDKGEMVINNTGLAALTLLVAESDPNQKETLIKLIMNMLSLEV